MDYLMAWLIAFDAMVVIAGGTYIAALKLIGHQTAGVFKERICPAFLWLIASTSVGALMYGVGLRLIGTHWGPGG